MSYKVVYDASEELLANWYFPAGGLIFVLVGCLLVFSPTFGSLFRRHRNPQFFDVFSKCFLGFAVFWTVTASVVTFFSSGETASASKNNTCLLAEGTVENFDPMPHGSNKNESYTVDGVRFRYSDYEITGGYNNTVAHGGKVSEGITVRLCYIKRGRTSSNVIVRVEIAS